MAMASRAADPRVDPYTKAADALRVLPQLAAAELQACIAFRLDPFSFLLAKAGEKEKIAAERETRIELEAFRERERRQRASWGAG